MKNTLMILCVVSSVANAGLTFNSNDESVLEKDLYLMCNHSGREPTFKADNPISLGSDIPWQNFRESYVYHYQSYNKAKCFIFDGDKEKAIGNFSISFPVELGTTKPKEYASDAYIISLNYRRMSSSKYNLELEVEKSAPWNKSIVISYKK